MPARDEMPSTLRRSPKRAREIWAATHDSAVESYGEGARAHQTALAALKHEFEKVGDHWEAKEERGPSDPQAERTVGDPGRPRETAGGVDANASKRHLYELAARLDVRGRSRMTKAELVEALQKANERETRKARE